MQVTGFYPVLCTDDVEEAGRFWVDWFGFEVTFAADWYVSLRREPGGEEIAVLQRDHPTLPDGFRRSARGVLINVEVADVDAEWERLVVHGGLEPALDLRSEDFGQRHFIVVAPGGVLVDVITEIPPSGDYLSAYGH